MKAQEKYRDNFKSLCQDHLTIISFDGQTITVQPLDVAMDCYQNMANYVGVQGQTVSVRTMDCDGWKLVFTGEREALHALKLLSARFLDGVMDIHF